MVGGTGLTVVKYLLFVFNVIFWLSGLALICVGSYVQITTGPFLAFYGENFIIAPVLLICTGIVVCGIGLLGCCGAIRENYCMLITFSVFLGFIFMCEVAAGIAAYVLRHRIENAIKGKLQDFEDKYNPDKYPDVVKSWDSIQQTFKCCGVTYYADWKNEKIFADNQDVPDSCCVNVTKGCGKGARAHPVLPQGQPQPAVNRTEPAGPPVEANPAGKGGHTEAKKPEEKEADKEAQRRPKKEEKSEGKEMKESEKHKESERHPEPNGEVSARKVMKRSVKPGILGNIYTDGCAIRMKRLGRKDIMLLGGVGIGVGCLQIIGIVLSCFLGNGVRRGYDTV